MTFLKKYFFATVLVGCFAGSASTGYAELEKSDFEVLQETLKPDSSESWRQIPWRISLLDGQRAAASEAKPIFIWAMDGHPLGCT